MTAAGACHVGLGGRTVFGMDEETETATATPGVSAGVLLWCYIAGWVLLAGGMGWAWLPGPLPPGVWVVVAVGGFMVAAAAWARWARSRSEMRGWRS